VLAFTALVGAQGLAARGPAGEERAREEVKVREAAGRMRPLYELVDAEIQEAGPLPPGVEPFRGRLKTAVSEVLARSQPGGPEPTVAEADRLASVFARTFTFETFEGVQEFVSAAAASQHCPDL
jgi:hypothetical protein